MPRQTFPAVYSETVADAAAVTGTTETIIVPDYPFPAGEFNTGVIYRARLMGVCSNIVTTPGTLTYFIRLGTTTLSSTLVAQSAALGLDTTARTNFPWQLDFQIICQSPGSSGTALILGQADQSNVLASTAANLLPNFLPNSAPAAGTVNTTVANILSVSAKFSLTGNSITCKSYILECLT